MFAEKSLELVQLILLTIHLEEISKKTMSFLSSTDPMIHSAQIERETENVLRLILIQNLLQSLKKIQLKV